MLMKSVSFLSLKLLALKALLGESLYHNNQQMGNISLTDFFFFFLTCSPLRELVGNQDPSEGPSGKKPSIK